MLNITILTASNKYSYHTTISTLLHSTLTDVGHTISILDIDSYQFDHQCLIQIEKLHPDVLITLDLTGFRFRTQTGENALNMLHTKNLNLIWGDKPEYTPYLTKKISMSMLFYDATGQDNHLPAIYPNMLYYKALTELTDTNSFKAIWKDFTTEVLLFPT